MSFPCPYCRHSINLKDAKPGHYKPKCPGCGRQFRLLVPDDPAASPIAKALPDAKPAEPAKTVRMPVPAKDAKSQGARTALMEPPAGTENDAASGDGDATAIFTAPPEHANATVIEKPTQVGGDPGTDDYEVNIPDNTDEPQEVPESMDGYRIMKQLGRGGMGAVYLAQQTSLDRPVALKVMSPQWGDDAGFVARFTREAYAAAQLSHHNIVQIYDFGAYRDLHYFSMEFVEGKSLGDMIKKEGKMDVEQAVGYTLQAARGLKFAHDRGMIHRDVKPDNLLLNAQGIVKVADLGLVKTPGAVDEPSAPETPKADDPAKKPRSKLAESAATNVTRAGLAMGTPAYMSPEQAKDAAHVDQRADVYSLGCTLYAMITGKPPFSGKSVFELFSKHASEPIVPPDVVIKRVPKEISAIVQKMVAKKPEERFQDMDEVVKALEQWLGIRSESKDQSLSEEQVSQLEDCVRKFNDSKIAQLRAGARIAIFGGSIALALILLLFGFLKFGLGALFLAVEAPISYFLVSGFFSGNVLFLKFREAAFESRWKERLQLIVGLLLFVVILYAVGMLWVWLAITLLAVGLAFGLYFGLDRPLESSRRPALDEAEDLFKKLRLRGMGEEELRQFVCKYAGNQWEEFYEALFGYEEKQKARDWWVRGEKGQARKKFAAWREPLINWLETRLKARHEAREKAKLQQVEAKRLEAEGLDRAAAQQKAEREAQRLVQHAAEFREEDKKRVAEPAAKLRKPKPIARVLLQEIEPEEVPAERASPVEMLGGIINLVLGSFVRFLLGAALLAGFLFWMYQNGLIEKAQEVKSVEDGRQILLAKDSKPLDLVALPNFLTKPFAGYAAGLAGFLLLLSSVVPSWKTALLMPLAAVIIVLGPSFSVPNIGPLSGAQICMAAGGFLGLVALAVGGRKR
ncbi:MAG TPA: protein kinase [Gemmataceae bacterium]|jgi:serine/threonine protein kinase|nr:protein kinase [Gemmataceae bacterium]